MGHVMYISCFLALGARTCGKTHRWSVEGSMYGVGAGGSFVCFGGVVTKTQANGTVVVCNSECEGNINDAALVFQIRYPTDHPTKSPIACPTSRAIACLTVRLSDPPTDRATDRLTIRPANCAAHRLSNRPTQGNTEFTCYP